MLDTGAFTRGSGSKNDDKERNIRRWFVEHDLIDGVILLPDNLFYNTTAAGVVVVLSRRKPKARRGSIVLVNAGAEYAKGTPKNRLTDAAIAKIAAAFLKGESIPGFVEVISTKDAAAVDFNLSPSRFVVRPDATSALDLPSALAAYETASRDATKALADIDALIPSLRSLGERD